MSVMTKEILADFEQQKEYMEDRIQSGIEANRKGWAKIRIVDEAGNEVPDAHLEIRQITHDFKFGCNLFMLDELEFEEKNREYKKSFCDLFNLATIPFYWSDLEPEQGRPRFAKDSPKIYRRPAPDLCLEFCKEHGIEPKLHCLNYDQWTPIWVPKDVSSVKKYLDHRMAEISERYADKIPSMEVINETLCREVDLPDRCSTDFFKEDDIIEWSFEHARKYLPANELIINEATHIWEKFKYNRSPYYMQIERALAKGASIDAIGLQYHIFHEQKIYNPELIYNVMDLYGRFGKPLQITETTIPAYSNDPIDEELQAEIITNLYKIWFSHPNMEAIIYWNLIDGYAAFAEQGDMTSGENRFHGALMRFDLSKKPAYYALKKLIHEDWKTNISVDVGNAPFAMKGFYGKYEISATVNGKTATKEVHIRKGGKNEFTIALQ